MRSVLRLLPAPLVALVAALVVALAIAPAAPALAVGTAPTTTTIVVSPAAPVAGSPLSAVVTVSGSAPSGSVTLASGATSYGSFGLVNGAATVSLPSLAAGKQTLTASYAGDEVNAASVGTLPLTVAPKVKAPKVVLIASKSKGSIGDEVVLRWRTRGAEKLKASGGWRGKMPTKGTEKVRLRERGENVFTLTASNAGGEKTAQVTVMAARKAKELGLTVTDGLVVPGARVAILGTGLDGSETWVVRLAGKVVLSGRANPKGEVKRSIVVPKTVAEGALPLTLTGSNPSRLGSGVLNVITPRELPVTVESPEVAKGATQTISLTGLGALEQVTVTYQGEKIAQGKADADGKFTLTFEVGTKKGEQKVTVVGAIPGRKGESTFTVKGKDRKGPVGPTDV